VGNLSRKKLTKEQALQKLRHYCAYQERSHKEVKDKLYGFGLNKTDVEEAISMLIEENYLNEERYAAAFAGGYFRTKQWGRVKIMYELKQKGISQYCINKALREISDDDYLQTILSLARKRAEAISRDEMSPYERQQKIVNYLVQKGFEPQLAQKEVKTILAGPA